VKKQENGSKLLILLPILIGTYLLVDWGATIAEQSPAGALLIIVVGVFFGESLSEKE